MIHELKILPEFFEAIISGEKKFEIRKNDRNYKIGDILRLREFIPSKTYTKREIFVKVVYILYGDPLTEHYGLLSGYCCMSIEPVGETM